MRKKGGLGLVGLTVRILSDMLDGCSCLISGALSSSSEQDSEWVYMRYSFIEVPNGKRGFEDEEGEVELFAERKPSKRLGKHGAEVISPTLHNLFPSTADACNKQSHDGDEVDVNCNPTEGKKLYGERKLSKQMDDLELSLSIISDEERKYVNGAPNLKDGLVWKKSSKLLHLNENDELTLTMHDLHLSAANVSNQQSHDWYRFDGKGKWPLEDLREVALLGKKKSSKRLEMHKKDKLILTLHDLRISSVDQSDQCDDCDRRDMKGKRPCEDVEEELLVKRKSSKRLFMHVSHEVTCMLKDCFLSSVEQSDQHGNDGDQADTSSLIQSLGRDISINCLLRCSRSDYNSLASLNRSFRNLIRNGELYRLRRQMQVIEHWVYFSCDILEWEAFDPICRRWMHLPRMPANDCFRCSDKESLAVGTELLVFGKEITSNVIWKYSILTNSWSSGMEMNAPRCLFGSASSGEIAILAGGCDSQGKVLSSAELYNSEKGTWENLPSMKKPRKMCSGVFMDGKFYVIGGSNTELLSCGEEYNLETKTWREIPNMCPRRTGPTEAPPLVAVVNNELYAADYAERELMKYNKERVSWDTVGRLPERAVSTNGWGLAFRACGDQIIVIGGPRSLGGAMIELNSWVPGEGLPQWNLLARKQSGGFVYNCAVMGC